MSVVQQYPCEWAGPGGCRAMADGYAGGDSVQHPLCAEHLLTKYHPPSYWGHLHPGEPITSPCQHVKTRWLSRDEAYE